MFLTFRFYTQAKGVHRIAVGIGKQIKTEELETIAGSPDRVVNAASFDALEKELDKIREVTCSKYFCFVHCLFFLVIYHYFIYIRRKRKLLLIDSCCSCYPNGKSSIVNLM